MVDVAVRTCSPCYSIFSFSCFLWLIKQPRISHSRGMTISNQSFWEPQEIPGCIWSKRRQCIGLRENWNRKPLYLMGKSMVSCRFSHQCSDTLVFGAWFPGDHGTFSLQTWALPHFLFGWQVYGIIYGDFTCIFICIVLFICTFSIYSYGICPIHLLHLHLNRHIHYIYIHIS